MKNNREYHGSTLAFIDMLFNILLMFALLFLLSVIFMNPPTKQKDMEAKAELLVIMTWPDNNPHDFDLWIKVPEGLPISYFHKENTYLFLERDDLGANNNYIIKDDKREVLPTRREVATFRGKPPGRYVVNSIFYLAKDDEGKPIHREMNGEPIEVVVELIQINPVYKVLATKKIFMHQQKEEKTAFSFIIRDNTVSNIELEIEEPFSLSSTPIEGQ